MKRITALILAIVLCLCAAGAVAGGFDDLLPVEAKPLLDPAALMNGVQAEVLRENYAFFEDYICTAYTYPMPLNVEDFQLEYRFRVKELGFKWEEKTVEGMDGFIITAPNDLYAMLFPYFNGDELLLLVQNGLKLGTVKRTNYLSMIYNSREYSLDAANHGEYTASGYSLPYFTPNARYFEGFVLHLPPYADVGDEFYVSGKEVIDGFTLMIKPDFNFETLVADYLAYGGYRDDCMEGKDFFRVEITEKERNADGMRISGTFEGRFVDYFKSIGKEPIYFEDGEFSMTVPTK